MIRREHQRFSLRKYKVGVASVFLGFGLSFALAGSGEAQAAETNAETAAPKTEVTAKPEASATTAAPKAEAVATETPAATPAPAEEAKPAVTEEAKPATEETAKPEVAEGETNKEEKAEEAKPAATEAKPASDESNKPRVRNRRAVTNEAVSGEHNSNPVAVSTYLKDGEKVTPEIKDANGATVSSQPVPSGYSAKEGDWYTYSIVDLTKFNSRYNTNYYTRAYKRFDESTDTTVELIDKNTGNVVETRKITASSGIQKFTTTTTASRGELTWQVDYNPGTGAGPGKTDQPFIQFGYEVGANIQALVAPGHVLTPDEQKLYDAVYDARNSHDIINVVEPAYNGREITDTNAKIPVSVEKTTYYRVVDKNNPTFNTNKTDKTVQDYVPNGNEVDLAKYTLKAMEGQNFTASGERQFDGYKLYQTADANDKSGYVSRPYKIGTRFMDAERAGIKRIKEIVGEDGTVVVRVYLLDPKQQSKRSDGSLSTDGYMLLAETKPIKPGDYNKQELAVKKSPLHTIAFTDSKGVNYPNGKEVPFDFQKAAGYTPMKTVFVPFLGDNIGHLSPNEQLVRGVNGIGTNVDLLNTLTPYKQPVYYYVKQEPVEVTPEVEKQLEGRVLANGEFTFKLKEVQPNKSLPAHEETVTNKADGKATFSKLTFNKVGTYTYTITETPGSDANVEYDAMTVTMTVNVTENAQGELQATVKYSAEGGFKSSADDKVFNNYVVAPVKTKFDFTKKLAGRELKDGEFKFVLKDANGQEVETVTNKADGTVTFTELSFDNSKVGTHTYTVEEVIPAAKEAGMVYDTMKATITVEVAKNGHTLTTVTNVVSTGGVDANGKATDGTADKEFNNKITPPETPVFQPEKFVLNKEKFDLTGTKLMDDDDELQDEYTETNANPYADQTKNNEAANINTKTVNRGDKLVYQVWLDTTKFSANNKENVQSVGISDDYDEAKLDLDSTKIKAYDSVTGDDVTNKFDITVNNGVITATLKAGFTKSLGDADNTQVIDTTKFAFGRYYKFDIPTTVKADVAAGVDIENTAAQVVNYYNPVSKTVETPNKPTQKRVNNVPVPVEFNFTKKLEGRELKANEFSFVLKDSTGKVVETVSNDADGKVKFTALQFKKGQEGVHNYTVEEVAGTDTTVTYDTMKANVTVTVSHDGTAKVLVATVGDIADKEFNNVVTPPTEPKFQPEKYVLNKEKFSITDNKLLDDDSELTNKYTETNTNPYVDQTNNNEAENINTKTVNRGDKLVYQVWLDTTKFSANNKENVQSVGISDDYDEAKLDLDSTKIKAYDSVTGDDVTNKFDITVNNGVITATLKAGFTKSLGDADNTQVIDTTKFEFGRYYKFDIPATVKADVAGGVDIENTAAQVVNYYNPVSKTVEKPNKPTEKRVNSVPV